MGRWDWISDESAQMINKQLKNFLPDQHKTTHWEILKSLADKTGESVIHIMYQANRSSETNYSTQHTIVLRRYEGSKRNAKVELLQEMKNEVQKTKTKFISSYVSTLAKFCGYKVNEKLLKKICDE